MCYNWNPEKFRLRHVIFREMMADLLDDGVMQKFTDPKKDPFWDPEGNQNAYPEKSKAKNKETNGKTPKTNYKVENNKVANNSSCCNIY
jgi:hypothetical protein